MTTPPHDERAHSGVHRLCVPGVTFMVGNVVEIGGDEAHHAISVKRAAAGDRVELLSGIGAIASGVVISMSKRKGSATLGARIESVRAEPTPRPMVEVWSAIPKGDRASQMIDQLAQVGVWSWSPLETARGVADAGAHKLDRLSRVASESSKQCGRAWHLRLEPEKTLADAALVRGARVVMADASGGAWTPSIHERVVLLIGPEGGWTDAERAMPFERVRFGPHVMRIETAAVAAATRVIG